MNKPNQQPQREYREKHSVKKVRFESSELRQVLSVRMALEDILFDLGSCQLDLNIFPIDVALDEYYPWGIHFERLRGIDSFVELENRLHLERVSFVQPFREEIIIADLEMKTLIRLSVRQIDRQLLILRVLERNLSEHVPILFDEVGMGALFLHPPIFK